MSTTIMKNAMAGILLALLGATEAMGAENPRTDLPTVAVIDTGVSATARLSPLMAASIDMVREDRPRARMSSPHGTEVATIIALNAKVPFRIVSMRADGFKCRDGECSMIAKAIAASVRRAVAMRVDIIQLSSSGGFTADCIKAFEEAVGSGIHIVFGAGNDGSSSITASIARRLGPNAHVVGSTNADGTIWKMTSRSGDRRFPMEWRPGVDVASENDRGETVRVTGTSFAAPAYAASLLTQVRASSASPLRDGPTTLTSR